MINKILILMGLLVLMSSVNAQSYSANSDIMAYGAYVDIENHVGALSDHAHVDYGDVSYGSSINYYKNEIDNSEWLSLPVPLSNDTYNFVEQLVPVSEDTGVQNLTDLGLTIMSAEDIPEVISNTNNNETQTIDVVPISTSTTESMFSGFQIENAIGGSYKFDVMTDGIKRHVSASNLTTFNATNTANVSGGNVDIDLTMTGAGTYKDETQVIGGMRGHPVGDSHTTVVDAKSFDVRQQAKYII